MTISGDKLLRAHARLQGLKANLPDDYEVESTWVDEFHGCLDTIHEATSLDLNEFRVPRSAVTRSIAGRNTLTQEVHYRDGLWCERSVLLQRLDSVMFYFRGLQGDQDKRIGFCT